MLYRDYDPDLGRWTSEDPLGIEGGLNLYAYVNDRPTTSTDPLGLVGGTISRTPKILRRPRGEIPGGKCGRTLTDRALEGECKCKDGAYRAELSVDFQGTIYVGTNIKRVSETDILTHELRHFGALLAVADAAHAAGGVIESIPYPAKWLCDSDVAVWKNTFAVAFLAATASQEPYYLKDFGILGINGFVSLCW
jgi:hypothetical protein